MYVGSFSVLIPSSPLQTDGPSLQHLNKGRPRPVRHHRRKPAALRQQADDQPDSVWDSAKITVEEPDTQKSPQNTSSKTPEPPVSKTPEPKHPEPTTLKTPEPVSPGATK